MRPPVSGDVPTGGVGSVFVAQSEIFASQNAPASSYQSPRASWADQRVSYMPPMGRLGAYRKCAGVYSIEHAPLAVVNPSIASETFPRGSVTLQRISEK